MKILQTLLPILGLIVLPSVQAQPASTAALGSTVAVWSGHTTVRERVDAGVNERIELWNRAWIVSPSGQAHENIAHWGFGATDGYAATTVTFTEIGRWTYWASDGGAIDSFVYGDSPWAWYMFPHNPPNGVGYGGAGRRVTAFIDVQPPTTYALTTSASGSGSVSGGGTYSAGSTATVTATPGSGHAFAGWQGSLSGTANPESLTMDGPKSVTAVFVALNTSPTIAWIAAPRSAASGQNYTITAHGHDADGNLTQVNVWKNGAPFAFSGGGNGADGDSGNTTSDTGPTTITYTAQAVDGAGATSATIFHTVSIFAANRAPTITWTSTPGTVASGQNYTVSARGHDDDGNLTQVNLWKNGAPFAFAGGGNGTDGDSSNATSDSGPASITYTAEAVDANGTRSATISQTVTISAPPAVTASVSANPASADAPGATTITWSSTNATAVSVSGSGLNSSATSGSQAVSGLPVGTYTYTITAQGTGGPVTQTATLTVNAVASVSASISASPTSTTAPGTSTISWSSANATSVSVSGSRLSSTSASGSQAVSGLSAGNYSYTITAQGSNGPATQTATVTVNAPANSTPTISWNTTPGSVANWQNYTVSAHGHDADGNLIQVNVWKNGAPFAFAGGGNGTDGDSGNTTSDAGPATLTFTANAVDALGATSSTITQTVTVAAPLAVSASISAGPATTTAPGSTTITWSSNNATSVSVAGPGLNSTAASGSQAITGLAAGSYDYTITAQGPNGPVVQTATVTVAPAATVSGTISTSPGTGTEPASTTVAWSTSNASSLAVSGSGLSSTADSGSQTVSGLTAGTHTYTLTAQGPGGPLTRTATFTVAPAVPNVSGSISASPMATTAPGSTTITWTTANAAAVTVSGPGLAATAADGTRNVTGLPAGSHTFTLVAQGNGGPLTRTVTITVVEPPLSYTVAATVAPIGAGTVSGAGSYLAGATATLRAVPDATHDFIGWTGDLSGVANPLAFVVSRNVNVVANFAATSFALTTAATAGGSVTPGGTYPAGTVVTVSATPDATHRFVNWTGDAAGAVVTTAVTLDRPKFVQANFTPRSLQTISFAPPGDHGLGAPPLTLLATATSGLPVSFSLLSGPAILTGNQVQVTGVGPVTVQASQPGDAFFLPAPPVNRMFNVIGTATLKYRGQSRTLLRDETTRQAPPYVLGNP